MVEQFANAPQSGLATAINASVTTLTVVSAASFSTSGTFRVIVDSEYMLVTAVAGATFTVTRGAEGSAAAAHLIGALVTQIITAGAIAQLQADARPTYGAPAISSGGVLTLSAAQTWGLFIAGDTVTFPLAPVPGMKFYCTHDQIRSQASLSASPVHFQRPGGATYTVQNPDGLKIGGVPLTAASVVGALDGSNYCFAFDGGSPGVMRCVSSLSSP